MSFRNLTHYFIHQALAGWDIYQAIVTDEEPEAKLKADAHSWESNMLRAGDERRLQAIGHQIEQIELDSELLTQAGAERLEEVNVLLHQARVACWKL